MSNLLRLLTGFRSGRAVAPAVPYLCDPVKTAEAFRPALLVVDLQEDFCPPNGSLAVANGRDTAPVINSLLSYPGFVTRIATKDWHPPSHISFAANHEGKRPFVDTITVVNPKNSGEAYETRLWPVHCVQGTPGAELIHELDLSLVAEVVEKGTCPDVEMYSAFYDPLTKPRVSDSGLAERLKAQEITHVYIVGLAADYCVKSSALDAVREGFATFIVEEGTRAVDPGEWEACRAEIEAAGVRVVSVYGPEVARLRKDGAS